LVSANGIVNLQEVYEAFTRRDLVAVLAALDEDITWVCPDVLPFGGTFRGHDGVRQFFAALPEHWQELRLEPEEFIDDGDVIVVPVRLRGVGLGGLLESRALHLWRMRGSKAVSFREYPDTARVLQAIGQPLPALV
jgi:ketosteroid isomerase-like protein